MPLQRNSRVPSFLLVLIVVVSSPRADWRLDARTAPQATAVESDVPSYDNAARSLASTSLQAQAARRAETEAPGELATLKLLAQTRRPDAAFRSLRLLIEQHPDQIAEAFRTLPQITVFDPTRNYSDDVLPLVALARTKIAALPREQMAVAARALLDAEGSFDRDRTARPARLQRFVTDYAGTEAAQLTEVDVILATPISAARQEAFEAFAAAHPGTCAAAKALYQKGWDLAVNASALRIEPRRGDPSARFAAVADIVGRLRDGGPAGCQWVTDTPQLVSSFSASGATYNGPESIDLMLNGYRALVWAELPRLTKPFASSTLAYVVNSRMSDLVALRGDRIAGVEQIYADLERRSSNRADIRFSRAQFYLTYLVEPIPDRPAVLAKAIASLRALHDEGAQPYARRALATLAAVHFAGRDFARARPVYAEFLSRYPTSDWAWIARLRLAQAATAMGDLRAASDAYAEAVTSASTPQVGRVIAGALAAEVLVEQGDVTAALRRAQAALEDWDDDAGDTYRTQAGQFRQPGDNPWALANDTTITKAGLSARVIELRASAASPVGGLIEQGRRFAATGRADEAVRVLQRAGATSGAARSDSALSEALHSAQLAQALDLIARNGLVDGEGSGRQRLQQLASEPLDFPVFVAQLARATATALGDPASGAEASALARQALGDWLAAQPVGPTPADGTLESDVAAIRAEVFRPLGGGVYGTTRWNAFEWPSTLPPFLIANPDLRIKLRDGSTQRVLLRVPLSGYPTTIFMDEAQRQALVNVITALGGTARRTPTAVMETPNQPAGRTVDVRAFWNTFFAMRPGHWSGWELETYPAITEIAFLDDARTRAAARVTVGYSGATIMLVKVNGTWTARELVGLWIT